MSLPDAVSSFLAWLPSLALPFLIAVSGVGALTMALLQAAKTLLPLRQSFYARHLRRWLARQAAQAGIRCPKAVLEAEEDLILLATGGDRAAFFQFPTERWGALFPALFQTVLDDPQAHELLLSCLAPRASAEERKLVLLSVASGASADGNFAPGERERLQQGLDARARINRQMQVATDALQISLDYRWQRRLQTAALALNALVLWSAMLWYAIHSPAVSRSVTTNTGALLLAFFGAIAGGVLAPTARDLVAVLEQLRRKPGDPTATA